MGEEKLLRASFGVRLLWGTPSLGMFGATQVVVSFCLWPHALPGKNASSFKHVHPPCLLGLLCFWNVIAAVFCACGYVATTMPGETSA